MAFACQRDSYLQKFETKIKSCHSADNLETGSNYAVLLEDTILFPEGGGQPDDFGFINGIRVNGVKRKGTEAVHYVDSPLPVGDTATVEVDWNRRFDHMQQHTGQHVLTAVAEDLFNFPTTSWSLGVEVNFIELSVPSVELDEIQKLEEAVNGKIRSCLPVSIHLCNKDSDELKQVRRRLDLPEDHAGPVRVIEIEGTDRNTCCGTHVKNTSELQMIKLLYSEKGKKGKTNLYFIVGNRILNYIKESMLRERTLNNTLGCNSENILEIVQKLQKSLKLANKNALFAFRDLASIEAKCFNELNPKPQVYFLHKKNAEPEFMTIFLAEVIKDDTLFFLTVGDGKNVGQFVLSGPETVVEQHSSEICEMLDAKGSGKNGKFQGKFNKISNINQVEQLLKSICT